MSYFKTVFILIIWLNITGIHSLPIPENYTNNCGRQPIPFDDNAEYIFRGKDAKRGSFPFVATIVTHRNTIKCGGAIVTERFIVTAATCLLGSEFVRVIVGMHEFPRKMYNFTIPFENTSYLVLKNDDARMFKSKKLYTHDHYGFLHDYIQVNNIGLVELWDPIQYNRNIQPVCLPPRDYVRQYLRVYVAGFGFKDIDRYETHDWWRYVHRQPPVLQYWAFNLLAPKDCRLEHYCTTANESRQVEGDVGNPVVINRRVDPEKDNTWMLFAVVSEDFHHIENLDRYGSMEGISPIGYTRFERVVKHLEWLEAKLFWGLYNPFENQTCGKSLALKILGPKKPVYRVLAESFPFVVAIARYYMKVECGGSLISDFWVVTTAHCIRHVLDEVKRPLVWFFGERTTYPRNFYLAVHAQPYFFRGGVSRPGDGPSAVCLLRLEERKRFSGFIQPVCLPDETMNIEENQAIHWARWVNQTHFYAADGNMIKCAINPSKDELCVTLKFPSGYEIETGEPIFMKTNEDKWMLLGIVLLESTYFERTNTTIMFRVVAISFYNYWIQLESRLKEDCGYPKAEVHNQNAYDNSKPVVPGSYPFFATLIYEGTMAQGALLNKQWIITVAHYFTIALVENKVEVFIGQHNLSDPNDKPIRRKILEVFNPSRGEGYSTVDIALVKLNRPVELSLKVQPICLPPRMRNNNPDTYARLIGFYSGRYDVPYEETLREGYIPGTRLGLDLCATLKALNYLCFERFYNSTEMFTGGSGALLVVREQLSYKEPIYSGWILLGMVSVLTMRSQILQLPLGPSLILDHLDWIEERFVEEAGKADTIHCGKNFYQQKYGDDIEAREGSFPFVVVIRQHGLPICEGAIIAAEWILTTANCLSEIEQESALDVVGGIHNLRNIDEEGTIFPVKHFLLHPEFEKKRKSNNIALINLMEPIYFTQMMQPVCLPERHSLTFTLEEMYRAGWKFSNGSIIYDRKKQSLIRLQSCRNCIDFMDATSSSCEGQIGSPVLREEKHKWYPMVNVWVIEGLISDVPVDCQMKGILYNMSVTGISYFIPWIKRTILSGAIMTPPKGDCGTVNMDIVSSKIYPFKAFIIRSDGHSCNGAIIHKDWIVTTTGCVKNITISEVKVIIRDVTTFKFNTSYDLSEIHIHGNGSQNEHNIVMLKLKTSINFDGGIQPICLPKPDISYKAGETFTAITSGGQKHLVSAVFMYPDHCQGGDVICFELLEPEKVCQWGSGDPLALKIEDSTVNERRWTLMGLISPNENDQCDKEPYFYRAIDLSKYILWIQLIIESFNVNPFPGTCGRSIVNTNESASHDLGEKEEKRGKYPFTVLIQQATGLTCVGAIIHRNWIISSAECAIPSSLHQELPKALIGVYKMNGFEYVQKRIAVINEAKLSYGIALLKVHEPILFTAWIQPICLHLLKKKQKGTVLNVIKWGNATEENTKSWQVSSVEPTDSEACGKSNISARQCFKAEKEYTICQGDYGAPVFEVNYKPPIGQAPVAKYTLFGVMTANEKYCSELTENNGLPMTSVASISKWINRKLGDSAGTKFCGQRFADVKNTPSLFLEEASPESFPFIVMIHDDRQSIEGVILNKWWILSTANFFSSSVRNKTVILLGVHNLGSLEDGSRLNYVNIVLFPPGDTKVPQIFAFPAMVKVLHQITFTWKIQPICLPMMSGIPKNWTNINVYMAGWEKYSGLESDGKSPRRGILLQRRMTDSCVQPLDGEDSFTCNTENNGTEGDVLCKFPGMPVFMEYKSNINPLVHVRGWVLLGITAPADCNNTRNVYSIFYIKSFMNWILNVFQENVKYPERCGMSSYNEIQKDEYGNRMPLPGNFPFVVSIVRNNKHLCAGALIENDWVITLKTCTYNFRRNPGKLMVILGGYDRRNKRDSLKANVRSVVLPPTYLRFTKHGERLTLLKLENVPISLVIQPICIFPHSFSTTISKEKFGEISIAGWGTQNNFTSDFLNIMPMVYLKTTSDELNLVQTFSSNNTCIEDNGSPIFTRIEDENEPRIIRWMLLGISFNVYKACTTQSNFLTVDLTKEDIIKWINDETEIKRLEKPEFCGKAYYVSEDEKLLKTHQLIYRGTPSKRGQWPWMAAIIVKNIGCFCGGTLITTKHVLTAATCVRNTIKKNLLVGLDLLDVSKLAENQSGSFLHKVKDIECHYHSLRSHENVDAAILLLKKEVKLTPTIQTICIPSSNFVNPTRERIHIVGWGHLSYNVKHIQGDILRDTELLEVNWKECQSILNDTLILPFGAVCAMYHYKGACTLDKGGPMLVKVLIKETIYWIQYGIIFDHTNACEVYGFTRIERYPVIGGKLSSISAWIEYHIGSSKL